MKLNKKGIFDHRKANTNNKYTVNKEPLVQLGNSEIHNSQKGKRRGSFYGQKWYPQTSSNRINKPNK